MNPLTHFFVGWAAANAAALSRRERAVVVLAGIAPDVDGLGIVAEALTKHTDAPLLWWSQYHHVLAHNLWFGLALAATASALATRRWATAGLALLAFHLHLLGDLIGARGPDGDQWPIPYLWPFSTKLQLAWVHQWALNAWPNFVLTAALLFLTLYLAARRGFSPLEFISTKADAKFVETLRRRGGRR
ncbi:MAG TPA: metal-dependent hydrolase [bacterium]|nr:metal-dependent hydrolase [bacterium]